MDGPQGGGAGQGSYQFVAGTSEDLSHLPPLPDDQQIGAGGLQWPDELQELPGHHESGQSSDFVAWAHEAGAMPLPDGDAEYDYSGRRPLYRLDVETCMQNTDFMNLHNTNYPRAQTTILDPTRMPDMEPDSPDLDAQATATSMAASAWYEAPYHPDSLQPQDMAFSSQPPMQPLYQAVTAQLSQSEQPVYVAMEPAYQMAGQSYGTTQPAQSSGAMVHVPQQTLYQPAVPAYSLARSLTPPQQTQMYPIRTNLHNYSLGLSQSQDYLRDSMSSAAWNLPQILSRMLDGSFRSSHASSPSSHSSAAALLAPGHCVGVTGVGGSMVPGEESKHKAPGTYQPFKPSPESDEEEEQSPEPEFRLDRYETNFQFVLNEPTPAVRSAIKAHVMKEMRRKRRWEKNCMRANEQAQDTKRKREAQADEGGSSGSQEGSPTSLTSPQHQKKKAAAPILFNKRQAALFEQKVPEFSKLLEHLEKAGAMPYVADPYAAPAPSDMDPFATTNMNLGPATGALLHHFAWVMPSLMDEIVSGTVFNRIGWLFSAVAVHDPTPAHVIIGYAMIHIANLRGVREPREAIEHKQRGENMIRMRAADPEQRYSDGLIGSMLNVAGWELIMCDAETHAIHIGGVREIVKVRGGIGAFAYNRELQNVLFRMDIIRAYIAMSEPRYPTYTRFREMAPLAVNTPPPGGERADDTREGEFCTDALRVIHQLEDVLLLICTTAESVKKFVTESQNEAFSASFRDNRLREALKRATESRETLEQHVRACLSPERSAPGTALEYPKRLRLAALVFIDAAIEHFFDPETPGSGRHGLEETFVGSRHDKISMATWGRSLQMVFHVLLKADRFMLEKPWRAFYFADALVLTMRLPKTSWGAIGEKLAEHLKNRTARGAVVRREPRLSHAVWDLKKNLDWVNAAWDGWEERRKDEGRERRAMELWYRAEERGRVKAEKEAAREVRKRARASEAAGDEVS